MFFCPISCAIGWLVLLSSKYVKIGPQTDNNKNLVKMGNKNDNTNTVIYFWESQLSSLIVALYIDEVGSHLFPLNKNNKQKSLVTLCMFSVCVVACVCSHLHKIEILIEN